MRGIPKTDSHRDGGVAPSIRRLRSIKCLRYPGAFGDYKFNHFSATTPSPDDNFM